MNLEATGFFLGALNAIAVFVVTAILIHLVQNFAFEAALRRSCFLIFGACITGFSLSRTYPWYTVIPGSLLGHLFAAACAILYLDYL